ncbi:MAG: response regulator [Bacteroidales bacterium]
MSGKTVLLVDDSRVARMMTRRVIEVRRPGWTVVEAATGEDALAVLDTAKPDFVVLDVNMPGLGGLETARLMRARAPHLPITLLTANIQDPVRHQAEGLEVGFLTKPLHDQELLAFLNADAP